MSKMSLVTAKVVRENEQYKYKHVGKGEKYLVKHEIDEDPRIRVIEYLTPYSVDPVVVVQVSLVKDGCEFIESSGQNVYLVAVRYSELSDSGKSKRVVRRYYVCADSLQEALNRIDEEFEDSVVSVNRTGIIEVL